MNDLRAFFNTLVDAYHGIALTGGGTVNSSHKSTASTPRLLWKPRGISYEAWQSTSYRIVADIPVELSMVVGADSDEEVLDAISDVSAWTDKICGMPIAADPKAESGWRVVPFGDKLWDTANGREKITYFGDRFFGPILNKATVRANHGKDGLGIVDLTFHAEFVVDTSVESKFAVRTMSLGIIPLSVAHNELLYRPDLPYELTLPDREAAGDTITQGGYSEPDIDINLDKTPASIAFPPVPDIIPLEPGADPSTLLQVVQPVPAAVTVSTTQQLQGIAIFADGGTQNVTAAATWLSSAPSVATVSSGGLVTAIGSGTATITVTYLGISGTSQITVP